VNLRVDGNIAGRTRIIDASGNLVPIRAKVTFMQYGRVVTEVRSDEMGHFQVVDMQPGVYAVVAIAGASAGNSSYLAAFGMRVLPYVENAPGSQRLLDIVLLPLNGPLSFLGEDGRELYRLLPQQPVMMGGGGGGGLGSLLGLAGLAGLAGLGGDGGGQQNQQASPNVP
jgi:hypothetical protein